MPYNDDENHAPSEFYHPEPANDPNQGRSQNFQRGGALQILIIMIGLTRLSR